MDGVLANVVDEFGQWRPVCNRFGEEYLAAYRECVKPSAPVEDYEGRLDLYKLYVIRSFVWRCANEIGDSTPMCLRSSRMIYP